MLELERRINISENRILIYNISKGYAKPTYTVAEGFLEDGDVKKTYSLSQWDDYGFSGWTSENDNVNKISFEFNSSHPLYLPLLHLLNYDDELIIDDDETREENKRYLSIYRKDNKMYVDFIDNVKDSEIDYSEKFHVFIKNIIYDGRSKIDQTYKDTKIRLLTFFDEVNEILTRGCHQISMEEYFDDSDKKEYEGIKKVFRRKY